MPLLLLLLLLLLRLLSLEETAPSPRRGVPLLSPMLFVMASGRQKVFGKNADERTKSCKILLIITGAVLPLSMAMAVRANE